MSLRWRGAPPTPPPRDPAGINSIVQQHRSGGGSTTSVRHLFDPEEDMSSDSSSPPRPADHPHHKRRSSYENVDNDPCPTSKPPPGSAGPRRSTPSPRPHHLRASPCPSLHGRHASPGPRAQSVDHWSEATLSDEGEPVRRRPASACRAPRTHRGSMPPVDCLGSAWVHRGAFTPCCAPSPVPYHWCGPPPQNWTPHYQTHPVSTLHFVRNIS